MEAGAGPLPRTRTVAYLYGITRGDQGAPRVRGAAIETVRSPRLAALVELVDAGEHTPERIERRLESAPDLAILARKHETVLEAALALGPVIPARLCTLYRGVPAVRAHLCANQDRYLGMLAGLVGRREWGLKMYCDGARLRATSTQPRSAPRPPAAARSGHDYLLGKRREARRAAVAAARLDEAAEQVLAAIEPLATGLRVKPLLPSDLTGRSETMALNLAALVADRACPALHRVVAALAGRLACEGFAFELSGPWPAYSFCDGALAAREAS
ncbi:MAG: GvpL/GvpF family gas vesicle protein [Deltaproteobacteria bacterium]|nr:GvpL/GvpF family gas vesicle protein [Deltaproteobacteria bacterium]